MNENAIVTTPDPDSGVDGNETLTAIAGAVILVLAVVELVTVPALHALLSVHFFVGVVLLGPLAVKTASTGWRFTRYYTGSPAYRRKGPPRPLQRVLGPVLLASTLVLVGSGIALAIAGPAPPTLIRVHVLSFLVWIVALVIHVVAYLRPMARLTAAEVTSAPERGSERPRRQREAANIAALLVGAVGAVFVLPTTAPWVLWLARGEGLPVGLGLVALVVVLAGVFAFTAAGSRSAQPNRGQ